MARITFTPAQKAKALMLIDKGMTGSAVADKIGCSLASIQVWKRERGEGKIKMNDPDKEEEEYEEEEATPHHQRHSAVHSSKITVSREDFIKKYWQNKSVDTVMKMPETIDEVVNLINNALSYAYTHLAD